MNIPCDQRPSAYRLQGLAHCKVQAAKRRGDLPILDGVIPCQDCGEVATMYEHRDYRKPLDVRPVCRKCNIKSGSTIDTKEFLAKVRSSDRLISSNDRSVTMNKKRCERKGCAETFDQIVPWKIYCSPSCKQIAWALRQVKKSVKK